MSAHDITRLMIQSTLQKSLEDIAIGDHRALRRLVDLGEHFSSSGLRRRFLNQAQDLLTNEESAYYTLIQRLVQNTDREQLTQMGLCFGYECLVCGVAKLREEWTRGNPISWQQELRFQEKTGIAPEDMETLVTQGESHGVRCYSLFIPQDASVPILLDTTQAHLRSFFLLFVGEHSALNLKDALGRKNVLPLLPLSDAARLRESAGSGYLFGAYAVYNETTYKQILDDSLLELALDRQTPFLFLLSETGCSLQTQHRVWNYIRQQRIQQQWPLFPLEYKMDMAYIDQVVIPQSADGANP